MPVLAEGISVIVKVASIMDVLPDGLRGLRALVPNATFCSDGDLARVGFMHPDDVAQFVQRLEQDGLTYLKDGAAVDMVVVDQQRGAMARCDWIEVTQAPLPASGGGRVTIARLPEAGSGVMVAPDGWTYEGSLSETFAFVPTEHAERTMKREGRRGGIERFKSLLTGRTVFMGRTSGRDDEA